MPATPVSMICEKLGLTLEEYTRLRPQWIAAGALCDGATIETSQEAAAPLDEPTT